jgi:C-terminal processing protease CtpA/Prc
LSIEIEVAPNVDSRLIVDLRWNNGGNTFLTLPFLHRLIGDAKVNRRGALYVIIGRRTYSAAQNFTTMLELHTEATFVG